MVSAYFFGVSGLINAFTVAIQIPNLVRALVADAALSGAFVPVFSELLEKGERKRAWRVASTLFWLTLLILGGLTAVFILLAPLLMRPFGDPGGDYELAVGLSRVLFPIVVLLGLSGIVVGILNTYHHFAVPALAPVAWNLVIVVGLVLGVPRIHDESAQLYLYAGVVVLGTLVQLLLPIPWLRRLDGRLTVVIDWRDPAVKRVLVLMLPVTLTIGLINVNFLVDTLFASRLLDPELAPAAIDKAFRLYMLPQGVFAVAVTTVLFPTLARFAARDDIAGLRRALDGGLRQIAFLLVPAGLVSIVLAQPIVRLVYQRGEFTAEDTVIVAQCLQAFSIGLVFNGWMLILNRSFYAVQTNWVPTGIAVGAVALNAAFDTVFYRLGIWGIPLATSTVNVVAATVLLVMMRRRVGPRARPSHPRGRGAHRRRRCPSRRSVVRSVARARLRARHRASRPASGARRRVRRSRSRLRGARPGAGPARARGVATVASPARRTLRPALSHLCSKTAFATSRSSRTSTTASRRSRIASSS